MWCNFCENNDEGYCPYCSNDEIISTYPKYPVNRIKEFPEFNAYEILDDIGYHEDLMERMVEKHGYNLFDEEDYRINGAPDTKPKHSILFLLILFLFISSVFAYILGVYT